jgi:hypothetical protein
MPDLNYLYRVLYILINCFFKQIADIYFNKAYYQESCKKGHVIRRNLKIPNARVSRFVDWCAVMTLESFSCVFCQSNEFVFKTIVLFQVWDTNIVIDLFHDTFQFYHATHACVLCQSNEFDLVTDWLKHSLQAIVVYVK